MLRLAVCDTTCVLSCCLGLACDTVCVLLCCRDSTQVLRSGLHPGNKSLAELQAEYKAARAMVRMLLSHQAATCVTEPHTCA